MARPNPSEDDLEMMIGRGGSREHGGVRKSAMPSTDRPRVIASAHAPQTFTLYGQLCSGKNQVQILWRNGQIHKYPNKTFTNWRAKAHLDILSQWIPLPPIEVPVVLTCQYTPGDLRTRDITGQLDAIFHLLVYAKVLKDDGLVHEVHWTRLPMNRKAPQITLTITEVA